MLMRFIFKLDSSEKNGDLFEHHFETYEEGLDVLDELNETDPDSLRQTPGFSLYGIVPENFELNDEYGSNALEKVANYANLILDGRATPEIKELHKQLISRNISLLEYEFEQGHITPQQLGVDKAERYLSHVGDRKLTKLEKDLVKWLKKVYPETKHKDRE